MINKPYAKQYPAYAFQERATQYCKDNPNCYLCCDMGLGKTRISLDWAASLSSSVLVLAPLRTTLTTWPDEIEKWVPDLTYQVLHGQDKAVALRMPAKFYLINYDGLPWLYKELQQIFKATGRLPFRAMIIDEGTMVKSPSTKRFKVLKPLKDACPDGIKILSGTPAPNSLLDLWAQYYLLDNGERLGKAFTGFKNEYFKPIDRMGFTWKIKSDEHADLIHKKIADITFRLSSDDYLELPECVYNSIQVEVPDRVRKQIKELENNFFLSVEDANIAVGSAPALSTKLRQVIQGGIYINPERDYKVLHTAKLDALKELVEEANGQGILCAIQFKFELEMLRKAFPKAPVIAGGTKDDPVATIRAWNRGEVPLLICHPASLSHGVNMQAGSHILVWYALPWSLEHYLQLNKRLHRNGQQHGVIIHHLVVKDSIDERIMKALQTKEGIQGMLLEFLRQNSFK